MRYKSKIIDHKNYDPLTLREEAASAGIPIQSLFIGSGQIVIEVPSQLTEQEVVALRDVITGHAPIWFEWTKNGVTYKEMVRCAEDVDKVTSRRIRDLIGGNDPIQEQLKVLRMSLFAHDVALFPNDYTSEQQTQAAVIRAQMLATNTQIEVIRTEGQTFKASKGWT